MKKYLLTILVLMMAALSLTAISYAVTVTYQDGLDGYTGTRDTFIGMRDNEKNNNGGVNSVIYIDGNPDAPHYIGLLKFTGINLPTGAVINSATLEFYIDNGSAPSGTSMDIRELLRDFSEGSQSWGAAADGEATGVCYSQPNQWSALGAIGFGTDCVETPIATTPNLPLHSWVSVDVTNSLKTQYASGNLFGWRISLAPGMGDWFQVISRDHGNQPYRPKLTIDYTSLPQITKLN